MYTIRGFVTASRYSEMEYEFHLTTSRGHYTAREDACYATPYRTLKDWLLDIGAFKKMRVGEKLVVAVTLHLSYCRSPAHPEWDEEWSVCIYAWSSKTVRRSRIKYAYIKASPR